MASFTHHPPDVSAPPPAVPRTGIQPVPPLRATAETEWRPRGGGIPQSQDGLGAAPAGHRPRPVFAYGAGPGTREPAHAVVTLSGEIDFFTAPRLRQRLLGAFALGPGIVVVDLSGVTFFGAAGVTLLVEIQQRAQRLGRDLRLVVPRSPTRRLLDLTGATHILAVSATTEEALAPGAERRRDG